MSLGSFLSAQEKGNGGISLKLYDCCGDKMSTDSSMKPDAEHIYETKMGLSHHHRWDSTGPPV